MSPCGAFRYWLRRGDIFQGRFLTFIMLNPSLANETRDDPTLRRCIAFAEREGYSALVVVNLYALISPRPSELKHSPDPVGPDNDFWLDWAIGMRRGGFIAAWGNNADPIRVAQVVAKLDRAGVEVHCFGINKNGSPKHPLYVASDAKLTRFIN